MSPTDPRGSQGLQGPRGESGRPGVLEESGSKGELKLGNRLPCSLFISSFFLKYLS